MPTVDFYSKGQVDALIAGAGGLPDPTSASAGDVLALDNNKDPAWVTPSGGDDWEELDISNLPTDWVAGDKIRIGLKVSANWSSTPSSWTSSVSSITMSIGVAVTEKTIEWEVSDNENTSYNLPIQLNASSNNYITGCNIRKIPYTVELNSTSNVTWFYITPYMFNASGAKHGDVGITRNQLSTYVSHIWRKRSA